MVRVSANLDFADHNNRSQRAKEEFDTLREAAILLRSDTVWSSDLDQIRHALAEVIDYYAISQQYGMPAILNIAKTLTKETHA